MHDDIHFVVSSTTEPALPIIGREPVAATLAASPAPIVTASDPQPLKKTLFFKRLFSLSLKRE